MIVEDTPQEDTLQEEVDELNAAVEHLKAMNTRLRAENVDMRSEKEAVRAALLGAPVLAQYVSRAMVRRALFLRREAWPPARNVLEAARLWVKARHADPRNERFVTALVAAVVEAEHEEAKDRAAADERFQQDLDRMHAGLPSRLEPDYPELQERLERLLTAAKAVTAARAFDATGAVQALSAVVATMDLEDHEVVVEDEVHQQESNQEEGCAK
jgi:hypothetical protein